MSTTPEHADDILLPADVAQLAGVTSECVVWWDRRGKLAPWRKSVGGVRLYLRSDVETFLATRAGQQAERQAR